MTIETRVEIAASAKAQGFLFVRSDEVAVISVIGKMEEWRTPLREVLRATFAGFEPYLRALLQALPLAKLLLFTATPFSDQHNALTRRRGLWGRSELSWLPQGAARSHSVEIVGKYNRVRFAGMAEISDASGFEAADFARTNMGSFLLISLVAELTEERVLAMAASVFPKDESEVDWGRAVALVETEQEICLIRPYGGFDDPEASIHAFLLDDLRRNIDTPRQFR